MVLIHISHLYSPRSPRQPPRMKYLWRRQWVTEWTSWQKDTSDDWQKKQGCRRDSPACLSVIKRSSYARTCPTVHIHYTQITRLPSQPASPAPSHPSAHAGGRKRLVITPFDLTMWRTSAIRLYYGQGYPGTCLLVGNDVACHWFKWQLDGSVSSAGTQRRHD